jgi:hypothetical protein
MSNNLISECKTNKRIKFKNPYGKIPDLDDFEWYKKLNSFKDVRIKPPYQMLVYGKTKSMKTSFIMEFIEKTGLHNRFYLFVKKPDEPLYKDFVEKLKKIEKKLKTKIVYVSTNPEDLSHIKFNPSFSSLVIFDDQINNRSKVANQNIDDLFIYGRKENVSVIYITHSYFKTSKVLRENINLLALKKGGNRRIFRAIFREQSSFFDDIISPDEIYKIYTLLIKNPINTLLIDIDGADNDKIRNNLTSLNIKQTIDNIKNFDNRLTFLPTEENYQNIIDESNKNKTI